MRGMGLALESERSPVVIEVQNRNSIAAIKANDDRSGWAFSGKDILLIPKQQLPIASGLQGFALPFQFGKRSDMLLNTDSRAFKRFEFQSGSDGVIAASAFAFLRLNAEFAAIINRRNAYHCEKKRIAILHIPFIFQ